ncbi:Uu.00g033990.m01.CDS01 [Anthostomella pinea]|uniref:Uu.00g033990.m01.CDS01 n=1 Tax=Anthostomella pinea TaxID=933095 RepID=A0AAI8V9Z9_9PEZI|nr:Uu.00g033990.m01.CDS01 [Anthostomella pinea]
MDVLAELEHLAAQATQVDNLDNQADLPTVERWNGSKLQKDEDILEHTHDEDEGSKASFCKIDGTAKIAIVRWLTNNRPTYRPIFIRITQAEKELSPISLAPFLGIDATLPQYRATEADASIKPAQNQYPVWHFFYGMLAEPSILSWVLELPEGTCPQLQPARTRGGVLVAWGGKYRAMTDAPSNNTEAWVVDGQAFLVTDEVSEGKLRFFKTEQYEVVRCDIEMLDSGESIRGLTFRFGA